MKRKTAYNLAIEALTESMKKYSVGQNTYKMTGSIFEFVEKDHLKYERLKEAIRILKQERDQTNLFAGGEGK